METVLKKGRLTITRLKLRHFQDISVLGRITFGRTPPIPIISVMDWNEVGRGRLRVFLQSRDGADTDCFSFCLRRLRCQAARRAWTVLRFDTPEISHRRDSQPPARRYRSAEEHAEAIFLRRAGMAFPGVVEQPGQTSLVDERLELTTQFLNQFFKRGRVIRRTAVSRRR